MSMLPETIASATKQETNLPRVRFFRVLRLSLAMGVAGVAGTLAWKNYTKLQSRHAFVNAEIVDVRNPISGKLQIKDIQPGQWLTAGTALGRVENLLQASALEVKQQELKSKIQMNQQQLVGIQQQIAERRQLLGKFTTEDLEQKKLGVVLAQQQVEEAQSQLEQSKFEAQTAQLDANRTVGLVREGAVTKEATEKAVSESNQALAAVKSAQTRVTQATQRLSTLR